MSECQTIMFINVICPKLEIKKATISFGNQTIDCQVLQINSNGEQGVQICINKQLDVSKYGKLKIELGLKDNLSGSYENLPAYFNNSIGKVRKGEMKFSKDSSFILHNNKYKSITTNSSGKRKKRIIMDNGESLCDELVTKLEYNFNISVQMLMQKAPIDAHKKEKN
ncbi:MAG: hypothetical protein MUF45_10525 [Spirosomaceae bacterium]|nr:hypothetical protein [Spirosomataceae bacterium]